MDRWEKEVEHLLQTYTLAEVLEMNDLTDEEVLTHLLSAGLIEVPEVVEL